MKLRFTNDNKALENVGNISDMTLKTELPC